MTKGRGEWRGNMVKILEDRVGSNIYITLSDPGETMENWTRIPCCGQFESSSRMTIRRRTASSLSVTRVIHSVSTGDCVALSCTVHESSGFWKKACGSREQAQKREQ